MDDNLNKLSKLSKFTYFLKKQSKQHQLLIIGLVIFDLILLLTIILFVYKSFQIRRISSDTQNEAVISIPTEISTITSTNNWKTYANEYFGLSLNYPSEWILLEQQKSKINSSETIIIRDKENNFNNELVIYSDPQPIALPGKSIEEDSDRLIEWTMSYVPAVSYYSPKIINKERIEIDGRSAIKYKLQLSDIKRELLYNQISIIFQFSDTGIRTLTYYLEGNNQLILDRILLTVKFADLNKWLTYSNTQYAFKFNYPVGTELYQSKPSDKEDMRVNMIIKNISCDITLIVNDRAKFLGKEIKQFKSNNITWRVSSYQVCGPDECQPTEYYYETVNGANKFAFYTQEDGLDYLGEILNTFNFFSQNSSDQAINWSTYTHSKFADLPNWKIPWSGFKLYYPQTWALEEKKDENAPSGPYLDLKISKKNGDYFKIIQGVGDAGRCLFPDEKDFNSFQGMGDRFNKYIEINKNGGIVWRLAEYSIPDILWTHQLCEKYGEKYVGETAVGYTKTKITNNQDLGELQEILERVEIIY